jgi:hypothetical protein
MAEMYEVKGFAPAAGAISIGPYSGHLSVEHHGRRPMRLWRMREEDSPGLTRVVIEGPAGEASVCVVPLVYPFPNEIRLGCTAMVDGEPVRVTKRWFRPVEVASEPPLSILRAGPFGFRIVDRSNGQLLAQERWGKLSIAGNLPGPTVAMVVAALCTPLTDAVSPFAWLRGL